MTTPKQDLKRLKIIETCHRHITTKGVSHKVVIMMPCSQRKLARRRFSKGGPWGQALTRVYSKTKILVMFEADQLITSLETVRRRPEDNRPNTLFH